MYITFNIFHTFVPFAGIHQYPFGIPYEEYQFLLDELMEYMDEKYCKELKTRLKIKYEEDILIIEDLSEYTQSEIILKKVTIPINDKEFTLSQSSNWR